MPDEQYRQHPTVHAKRVRKEYKGQNWLDYAKNKFLEAQDQEFGYFHLWGHSWEIEQERLWGELEQLLKFIRDRQPYEPEKKKLQR